MKDVSWDVAFRKLNEWCAGNWDISFGEVREADSQNEPMQIFSGDTTRVLGADAATGTVTAMGRRRCATGWRFVQIFDF